MVACLARAIEAHPKVQAYFDWRRRLVLFKDVDVVTLIEPEAGRAAIPHIIRAANRKTVREISDEIRSIQARPERSEQHGGLVALGAKAPRFLRMLFYWLIKRNPRWFKQTAGTVIVTSVGMMFGKSAGWGIIFLPHHTLGVTVGGLAQKPGVYRGPDRHPRVPEPDAQLRPRYRGWRAGGALCEGFQGAVGGGGVAGNRKLIKKLRVRLL